MSNVRPLRDRPQAQPDRTWSVRLEFHRAESETKVSAFLDVGDRHELTATGVAYVERGRDGLDDVGFGLAAAGALSQLAHFLVEAAANDVGGHRRDPGSLDP